MHTTMSASPTGLAPCFSSNSLLNLRTWDLERQCASRRSWLGEEVAVKAKTFLSRSCQMPLIPCC